MAFYPPNNSGGISSVEHDDTLIGDGTIGDPLGLAPLNVDGTTIIGDGIDNPLMAITNQSGKNLISGGISWSGTGYLFDVSALSYTFDGIFYTSGPDQVTMATADPTNNRFDVVVVDIDGLITVITGTASANPEFPTVPDDQLAVGYVFVEAASTSPTILTDNIYLDNAEWVTSTYTTGTGSIGTIDFNSTDAPKQGTLCAKATATNQRLGMRFTRATAIDVQTFAYVQIWARLTTSVATTKTLSVRFDNSLGNPVGNTVSLFNYGMSRTITGTWQLVTIPVSAFGSITTIKGLRAIMTGGVLADTATWSLDFMLLSGGILPQGALGPIYLSPSNTLYSTGAAVGATAVADSIFFGKNAGFRAASATNSFFFGSNAGYNAISAAESLFIGSSSGYEAASALYSIFIGSSAGYQALNANNSNFLGFEAGRGASDADNSNMFGYHAGYNAPNASNCIFIGTSAGENDTVNNTTSGTSILIGEGTSTGGFSNSIAIGEGATNTAVNQFICGSSSTPINDARIIGTGGFMVPVGSTAERIAVQGMIRYNTTTSKFEGYDGAVWQDFY